MQPTREQAEAIVEQYNDDQFHRQHARVVAGVMAWYAAEYDPGQEDYWYVVGMLHDVDFEQHPEQHCVAGIDILRSHDVDESIIASAMSHGWGMSETPYEPQSQMDKILFASDELTGFIGAVALMRPSKSVSDMEVKSVRKKLKQPSFAAGVSREAIQEGADMLGWTLDELIDRTISAMRSLSYVD